MNSKPVLCIKQTRYRHQDGFLIYGKHYGGFGGPSVFTTSRKSAELIKGKLALGQDITTEDFNV